MAWRTIESAPKDGTPILIFTPKHERKQVCEAWWARDYEEGPGYWMTPLGASGRGYTILPSAVTHWQPLPDPPADWIPEGHVVVEGMEEK